MQLYMCNNKKIFFFLTIILVKSKIKQNKISERLMIFKISKNTNLKPSKLLG
jgi:hypothetical protein